MNRRRPVAETNPPALIRMARGDRPVIWPLHVPEPMAPDGRPDQHVYVRRDIVRRALVRGSWDVLPPERKSWVVRVLERVAGWVR